MGCKCVYESEWKGEVTAGRIKVGSLELSLTPQKTFKSEIQGPEGGALWVVQISQNSLHFRTQDTWAQPAKPYSKTCEFPKRFNFQALESRYMRRALGFV